MKVKIEKIGFVIPCYKRLEYAKKLVSSIRSKHNIEIIIVDDCSEDGTSEWAIDKGYTLINHPIRMGVSKSCNDGIKKSLEMGVDYMIISNSDIILHKDCVDNLANEYENDMNSSAMPGPRTAIDGASYIMHTGKDISYIRLDTPGVIDIIDSLPLPKRELGSSLWHFYIISKAIIEKIGYFDENFPAPMYFEDNDYMRRLNLARLKFYSISNALAFHVYSPKYGGGEYNKINSDYYLQKWGGPFNAEKYRKAFNGNPPPNIKTWCI